MADMIYTAQTSASSMMSSTSTTGSVIPPNFALLYGAGLITSFSPCALGLLPVTMSYISTAAGEREDKTALFPTIAFAVGLASVFCGLGLSAALLGGVFGQAGGGGILGPIGTTLLAVGSSGVSAAMGLQILDLIRIPLPSFELNVPVNEVAVAGGPAMSSIIIDEDGNISPAMFSEADATSVNVSQSQKDDAMGLVRTFILGASSALVASLNVPVNEVAVAGGPAMSSIIIDEDGNISPAMFSEASDQSVNVSQSQKDDAMGLVRTFILGASSALVASPCATPVLTSILGFVAASGNPTLGSGLLLTYTAGYSTPLLVMGATGGGALARAKAAADDGDESGGIMVTIGRIVTPLTGSILIWYGTTGMLTAMFGDPSIAGLL
eukprot:CAMPEP_0194445664 /NCGR_PEP_ID=MMETSP0176-20130528/127994_1 /TAXON_ID=216777 /ORGANISM="Proboscia alata, Strain PI-D3" /LENGTH=381 /DNA_ID=CAMNT_0039272265 /DNA_START=753 /DNA_END=1898 /DNA_ORIENTATION=+